MSTKTEIHQLLVAVGFTTNYVTRAFRVYEKNYGHSYNAEVLTEIIIRLQTKDQKKLSIDRIIAHKLKNVWNTELSFDTLRSKGLVNCYTEWVSVKKAFGSNRNVNPTQQTLQWLKKQKIPFRTSQLSHIIIRSFYVKGISVPSDVEGLIISFCNFMFVKLVYSANNNCYEYKALDTNITIADLAKILEIEKGLDSNRMHILCRFGLIKSHLYPIKTKKMKVTLDMLKDNDNMRWVDVPNECTKAFEVDLYLLDQCIEYDKVLEIGVDICAVKGVWSFNKHIKPDLNMSSYSSSEWILSLQIGDIVEVFDSNNWCPAMIRYISDTLQFYIHYLGYFYTLKTDEIIDVSRLSQRYSHNLDCYKKQKVLTLKKENVNKIRFCWRTD